MLLVFGRKILITILLESINPVISTWIGASCVVMMGEVDAASPISVRLV